MDNQSLRSKASEATLLSLMELDPAPMDPPDTNKDLPPLPQQPDGPAAGSTPSLPSSSPSTTALGLSGSGHGAIYYLTRIQRYSSYTFGLFGALHLATTSLIPLAARSVPASESYLLLAREIYQTPLSEPLLVFLPVLAHVGSGVALRLVRRAQNRRRYYGDKPPPSLPLPLPLPLPSPSSATAAAARYSGWPPLSNISLSGYVFAGALAAHAWMNRGLPLAVEGDSANIGLAYVAHGFARHGAVSWLAYALLLGAGCGHMVWGWARWVGLAQGAGWVLDRPTGNRAVDRAAKKARRRRLVAINAVALAATALWAAGGLGIVARGGPTLGWVGTLYDGLYSKVPGF
ncbi:hypothetical protein MYCTH_2311026 [Thermothelomyces thermophilus ATCC 42464]|uniref:Mitochondrial adapter protein MCP1 transmembrane domain-containing protein n=1 Tax=Thermothelomyces thermophilus (strain ATCC 42464 / BCRC 31852 / DSM 1799) TaxID=573729 RepID=G2QMG7_THET4|nr:uncharacterized protein MYCTH_2311026 [Thermothelomyces thermophilus ATCC 42464]AEO61147.1 hypothetical protein MYCTH_2311026 [Thermothelomyces thermophilus ATCC 42464]